MRRFWIPTTDVCGPFASGKEELRAFLGGEYTPPSDPRLVINRDWQSSTRKTPKEIEEFYRSTDGYLWNLTRWHASNRFPYAEVIGDFAARHGFHRLLEFGCGIGTDGLKLLERGFDVTFYDFRNPSTEYLAWRLAQRGRKGSILYAGEDELPVVDLILAIDVLEHVVDPAGTLRELSSRSKALVPHFPITTKQYKHPMHFHLKKRQLRQVIRDQGFRRVWDMSQLRYKWGFLLPTETPDFWIRSNGA